MAISKNMKCPECGNQSSNVVDSRQFPKIVRRRRQCKECFHRFTTCEFVCSEKKLSCINPIDGRRKLYKYPLPDVWHEIFHEVFKRFEEIKTLFSCGALDKEANND